MATFLFDEIIFGPVSSRRLGNSLGINLLPTDCKVCNLNCIYCECGWTNKFKGEGLLKSEEIIKALENKLSELKKYNTLVDTITFAGNGEPTMHPEFDIIIEFTIKLRNQYFPRAKVAVLSNSTMLNNSKVYKALQKVDMNILKLDSAFEQTIQVLNRPTPNFSLEKTIKNLEKFEGKFILQTMFVRGSFKGQTIDNTTKKELDAWLELVEKLNPEMVMVYTIRRDTPVDTLETISKAKLEEISKMVKKLGIEVSVSS